MLARQATRVARRSLQQAPKRNMSGFAGFEGPAMAESEKAMHAADTVKYKNHSKTIVAAALALCGAVVGYKEYNHIKHMEHHPYAKPMFSWMRMSSKTKALPWNHMAPGCHMFDSECMKAGGASKMDDSIAEKAWH